MTAIGFLFIGFCVCLWLALIYSVMVMSSQTEREAEQGLPRRADVDEPHEGDYGHPD